eukprot:Gb_38954 [translate_table: standard]
MQHYTQKNMLAYWLGLIFEYWIFEIFIILSGLFPQPEISTSLIALWVSPHQLKECCACSESTEAIVYMLITGYGAAISTRVANELGAGCPSVAKSAICLTVKIGILVAIIVSMFLFLADSVWASAFTNSERIKTKFSSMVPLLSASILLDALQGIFSVDLLGTFQNDIIIKCIMKN